MEMKFTGTHAAGYRDGYATPLGMSRVKPLAPFLSLG